MMNLKLRLILSGLLLYSTQLFAGKAPQAACPTLAMSGSSVSCYGGSNGSAQVAISNGSNNYTITWSNGATATNNPGLPVGTYTVNVKDNVSGCSVIGAYVVGSPDPISVTNIITNVNCFSNSTGSVDISVLGGTMPYTYTWKNALNVTIATSQDLINVPSGTYTVNITDFKGCTFSQAYTITQPAEALNSSAVLTNPKCFGTATGAIDVSVWGGTTPYTYLWSTGQSTQDLTNITNGNYSLTITDSRGCTRVQNYNVTQPPVLAGTYSTSDVLCYNDPSGNASFSVTGGTAPFSYSWQNSTTLFSINSNMLNNVIADNYQVTVTDAKGCQYITTMTINQPAQLLGSLTSINVSCNGGSDGSIDLTVSGGTFPYTYQWSNSIPSIISSSQDLNNVVADYYSVVVLDNNNCQIDLTRQITQPDFPIAVISEISNVLCYGDNSGSIDLTVSGGTTPYSYSWSSGQTTQDITNLLAGVYGYTVVDAKGCIYTDILTISQPLQALTVTNTILDVNCYGESNGEIDLSISGGTSPYTQVWSNSTFNLSSTSEDLIGFPFDDYHYTVTDANGCISTDTLTINQPTQLMSTISGVNILCHGGNNGSVDLTVSGGVVPYSYTWSNGYTTEDLSTMIAGTYSVTVLDDHNCLISNQITLTEPLDSLTFTFLEKDVLCNDGTDGKITLTVNGGTTPYAYLWSNADTYSQINNLTAGMYTFTVTDFNNCILIDSIYVDQPDPLTLNELIIPVTCNGLSDGVIDISPVGGTYPYQFTWYNSMFALSAQTEDLVNYVADIYQVEIIDSNNCFYEMFFEIEQPDSLMISYTYTVVSCSGGVDGNIFVDIIGGNPGYTTVWSNGSTTEDLLNIPSNVYQLNVTDQKNCMDSIITTVSQPDSIKINFDIIEVTCIDQHNGVAYASPYGGNGGYYYSWSNGENTSVNEELSNQWYYLTVTDVFGCFGSDSVFITKNTVGCVDPVTAFSPNEDQYNDTWFIENMYLFPNMEMQIFNRLGNLIHKQTGIYTPWDGKVNDIGAPSDTYYYILNLNVPDREPLIGNITIIR